MLCVWSLFLAADTNPKTDTKAAKTDRDSLVIGRSNDGSDVDFSAALFDDFALWELDLRTDDLLSWKLRGKDCGDISDSLCMYFQGLS